MKKTVIHAAAFVLASAALFSTGYTSAKTNDSRDTHIDNNLQFPPDQWRLVKHTFRLNIPHNSKALSQLIIEAPSTVAVSNDIDVLDELGQKININVSANGRRIIIDFPGTVISNTKLLIELNKVKQPIVGSASVYNLLAKVVGSDIEIPVGVAQFAAFSSINFENTC